MNEVPRTTLAPLYRISGNDAKRGAPGAYVTEAFRTRSWTIADRAIFVLLVALTFIFLGADVAVVYTYLTSKDVVPGLIDEPRMAYLWAAVPIFATCLFGMLPYFGTRKIRIRMRYSYAIAAGVLFIAGWVPSFAILFSDTLGGGEIDSLIERLVSGNPATPSVPMNIFSLVFVGTQIVLFVLGSAATSVQLLVMIDDRRIERRIRNEEYDHLERKRHELEMALTQIVCKQAQHAAIKETINKKKLAFGNLAVAHLNMMQTAMPN